MLVRAVLTHKVELALPPESDIVPKSVTVIIPLIDGLLHGEPVVDTV